MFLVFFSVPLVMKKVNNEEKENRLIMCLQPIKKYEMILKPHVKNKQIKRRQACSACFVKVFKFQENKFKIVN